MKTKLFFLTLAMGLCLQMNAQVEDVSVFVTPTASYNWFDSKSTIKDGAMYGVQAGFGFGKSIELRGIYEQSSNLDQKFGKYADDLNDLGLDFGLSASDVKVRRVGGEFKANIPAKSFAPYFVLGTGIQTYKREITDNTTLKNEHLYASGGLGFKINLTNRLTFNVEGRAFGYNMSPNSMLTTPEQLENPNPDFEDWMENNESKTMFNFSVNAGLQLYLGGTNDKDLTAMDKAYMKKFGSGLSDFKVTIAPMGAYVDFDKNTNFRDTYLLGGEIGVDFTDYVSLRGYFLQSTEDKELSFDFDKMSMYGADFVGRLNTTRGIVPYVTLGGGYIDVNKSYLGKDGTTPSSKVFAKGGLGLDIPLGKRVDLFGAANLIYTTDKENSDIVNIENTDQLKDHIMYNFGFRVKLSKKVDTDEVVDRTFDKRFDPERKAYKNTLDAYQDEVEQYQAEVDQYEEELGEYQKRVNAYEDELDAYEEKVSEYQGRVDQLKEELANKDERISSFKVQINDLENQLSEAKERNDQEKVAELEEEKKELEAELKNEEKELKQTEADLRKEERGMAKAERDYEKTESDLKKSESDLRKAETELNKVKEKEPNKLPEGYIRLTPSELERMIDKALDAVDVEEDEKSLENRLDRLEGLLIKMNQNENRSIYNRPYQTQEQFQEPDYRSTKSVEEKKVEEAPKTSQVESVERVDNSANDRLIEEINKLKKQINDQNATIENLERKSLQKDVERAKSDASRVEIVTTDKRSSSSTREDYGSASGFNFSKGLAVFVGPSFGDATNFNVGIRSYHGFSNTSIMFTPDVYVGFGSNMSFGVNANAMLPISINSDYTPHVGLGLGLNYIDKSFKFAPNFIAGVSKKVGNSSVFLDYTARGAFKNNQIAVGYRFNF